MAGGHTATSATALRIMGTVAKAIGSQALTPKRKLAKKRVRPESRGQAQHNAGDGQAHALPNHQIADSAAIGDRSRSF
jgi:hypothetical protein